MLLFCENVHKKWGNNFMFVSFLLLFLLVVVCVLCCIEVCCISKYECLNRTKLCKVYGKFVKCVEKEEKFLLF